MPENQNRLGRIDEEYKKEISQIISYQLCKHFKFKKFKRNNGRIKEIFRIYKK